MSGLKISSLITILLLLTNCYGAPDIVKPAPWIFKLMPQDAPPVFKQGWIDGCKTGLGTMTNTFYKTFYRFTQDPVLRKDPLYYKTWVDTYNFCRHYIYGTIREGNVRMALPFSPQYLWDNMAMSDGVFNAGLFQNRGPGTWGLFLENWGQTAGQGFFDTMGGTIDFSDDAFINNKDASAVWEWDLRPDHSIAPYHD